MRKRISYPIRSVVLSVALAHGCAPGPTPVADLVFVGGPVYTQNVSRIWAEALAVRGENIVYVGSRLDADAFIGDETRVIDLDGRLLLPSLSSDALVAVHEAVNGRTLRGRVLTTESTRVEDAIAAHTRGSLVAGSPADLTVLQENILKIAPERIAEAKVEMTVARGRILYTATTFDQHSSRALE